MSKSGRIVGMISSSELAPGYTQFLVSKLCVESPVVLLKRRKQRPLRVDAMGRGMAASLCKLLIVPLSDWLVGVAAALL